jgi:predicted DCC family thiol-disulfide oxidoreductase YuxK
MKDPIVLFDGICTFCNGFVNFIIDRNAKKNVYFASLQSEAGQNLLNKLGLSTKELGTIVLIEGQKCYTKSSAILRIIKFLDSLWPWLYGFIIIPPIFRDLIYDIIARNRYKWFGQEQSCRLPTQELRERMLANLRI